MDTQNFSSQFDVLVNSMYMNSPQYASEIPLSFNEYEKSVFLTKAQRDFILDVYSRGSFESSEEMTEYIDVLIEQVSLTPVENTDKLGNDSYMFQLPGDLWFITYEQAVIKDASLMCGESDERTIDVFPVTQDHFYRTKESPFRGSNERRVLRLRIQDFSELKSRYPVVSYLLRYVRNPRPIILAELPTDLDIEGLTAVTECELNPSVHMEILDRAVRMALSTRGIQLNDNTNNNQ